LSFGLVVLIILTCDCYHIMFQYVGVVQFNKSCGMSIVITRPELLAYMYMFKLICSQSNYYIVLPTV